VLYNIASHGVTPARFGKRLTYDPVGDFAFPARIGGVPNIFMVHPSMPMKTLNLEDQAIDVAPASPEEFAAHGKAEIAKWTKVVQDAKLEAK